MPLCVLLPCELTHQLFNDPLYQRGEGDAVTLSVVIDIFDQFRDHLCVRLRLKLISFVDLRKAKHVLIKQWYVLHKDFKVEIL